MISGDSLTSNKSLMYSYTIFPESFYPPVVNIKEYNARLNSGFLIASNSSVNICALARNLGNHTVRFLHIVSKIRSLFKYSNVIIYENDSVDNTRDILKCADIDLLSENLGLKKHDSDTSHERTVDMAYYRNRYLERVQQKYLDIDYTIVLDSDLYGYSYEGIIHSLSYQFDAITANGILYKDNQRLFYDTWAYRRLGHPGQHISGDINQLRYERGEPPIKVLSNFGGMAIYKTACLAGLSYKAGDCDHVTLHKTFPSSIYLNPSLICLYSPHYYLE